MAGMNPTLTAPEVWLGQAAVADVFRFINLPYYTSLGGTDSPIFDQQAASDMTQAIMTATICGSSYNYFTGYIETGMTCSLESLIFCDSVIGMAKRFSEGIEVSAETLAEDVIDEVGPGGSFMAVEHTVEHFREHWQPGIFERKTYAKWLDAGSRDLRQRCIEKMDKIVEKGPTVRRDPAMMKEFERMITAYEKEITG